MTSSLDDIARVLPQYEIGAELGRGGMGVVLAGRHTSLDRAVAIKELPAALATDPDIRARFAAEARVLAGLDHPHIVPIYDYVEREGMCMLVMESLPGGTVWSHFIEQGFAYESACAIAMVTCSGLDYAHSRGVLHRDIKPENLLFSGDGALKVTDFGIAKVLNGPDTKATSNGDILGTPAYIAPEQAQGAELGPPADVYATAVMLYELLSGQLPYSEEGGAMAIVFRHVYEDANPIRNVAPQVPEVLEVVVMRGLARDPAERYPDAEAFGVAIGEAASLLWGAGWLDRTNIPMRMSGAILASAERPTYVPAPTTQPVPASDPRSTIQVAGAAPAPAEAPPTAPPTPVPASPTQVPAPPTEVPAPHVTPMVASAPAPATANVIRPAANDHVAGARPADIALDELVAVSDVLEPPARPVIQTVMTVAMVVLLIVLALSGIGGVDRTKVLLPGQATVAGVDPASGATVKIDFSKPVQVVLPQPPPDVAKVRLEFSVAGVALPSSATEPLVSFNNTPVANLAVSSVRYLIAGGFGASLVMLNADGKTIAHHDFAAARDGSGIATVPGAVSILLLLFVFATAESFLRPLRKSGKRKVSAVLGMAFIGAVFGVAVSLLAWVFASVEITAVSVVACAMVGLLAGVMMAITVAQYGRRRRAKRVLAQRAGRRVARAA